MGIPVQIQQRGLLHGSDRHTCGISPIGIGDKPRSTRCESRAYRVLRRPRTEQVVGYNVSCHANQDRSAIAPHRSHRPVSSALPCRRIPCGRVLQVDRSRHISNRGGFDRLAGRMPSRETDPSQEKLFRSGIAAVARYDFYSCSGRSISSEKTVRAGSASHCTRPDAPFRRPDYAIVPGQKMP